MDRSNNDLKHSRFWDLDRFLAPGDLLVLNETRLFLLASLLVNCPVEGRELLLLKKQDSSTWRVLGGGKGLTAGRKLTIENGPNAEIIMVLEGAERLVRFEEPIEPFLEKVGNVPLPPYIHQHLEDPERYQTVYAREPGSAAAPTAGLHFTPELIKKLEQLGVEFTRLILHVGLDTFAPVTETNPGEHKIHREWCQLDQDTADQINAAKKAGRRVIAVGTTSVRTLETAARVAHESEVISPYSGATDLFILPGFEFKVVDALITNFHLPKSTLLMLVSAFASRELILKAYQTAMDENYRFFSFGDTMLIL